MLLRYLLLLFTLLPAAVPVFAQQDTEALLLVARPQLGSPLFAESVVLVTRHGRSRPMGVILNKPTSVTLGESENAAPPRKIFRGGPVSPQVVVYVFREEVPIQGRSDLLRLGGGVFMGMGEAAMIDLLRRKPEASLKVFAGLASWAHGQLENEISRGDWLVLPFDAEAVMRIDTGQMWQELIARASQRLI